jgi:hypothetical protein
MAKKSEKESKGKSIKVRDSLKDFDISINSFGEISTNYDVDKINQFLNENVADKKLKNNSQDSQNNSEEESESEQSS